ncbi:MAG: glycine cleavage system aminomethyltransferase GcvT [Phycisphaerales bacterium]|nr:MAG: glycine cleavage system aminomethyltransferase GcvT [Phycisphaerales bacterium]
MHRTPLHQFHLDAGAKMVEFAGWEMPIMYRGVHEEHKQVRTAGGIFDVSHMGRVRIHGRHARRFLERICTRRINDMQPGQCRYSLLCNERGGVRDDILVYRVDDDDFLLVVNASNREKLMGHFAEQKDDMVLTIDDRTLQTAMVAIQGPRVMEIIGKFSKEIPSLKRYRFAVKNLLVMKVTVSRTGYTGEDGIEAILPSGAIGMAMKLMLKDIDPNAPDAPIKPIGLGARDTLRMEAGMPLYGHELGEDIDALSCGVDFAISLDKDGQEQGEAFIGMEALKKTRDNGGPARKVVGLLLDGKRTARQGMKVLHDGAEVGEVSSACMSPTLDRPIAMAFVDAALAAPGGAFEIDTGRDAKLSAQSCALPFYKAKKD